MIIKIADQPNEFEQIHRLNYKLFVEEIPQHPANDDKILVDKFHFKNKYVIALKNDHVIGMVCYNEVRPFSLDGKVQQLDEHIPPYKRLAEVRLLGIERSERKISVAYRLLRQLIAEMLHQGIDSAVVSGTTRQIKLYTKLGFVPFGNLVGVEGALYQPMFIHVTNLRDDFGKN
ncbi:GNAT family N-acetyltransferase [Chitinophaga qingshengii]|uniref:GNAT family N-acetyltransferase n=1 Tax=Chitinophaga qingshengii TaxID=1569794 RepID=A0ABR7TRL3_9BACT|nr:GNAT family N-acetyltransferase [Chitinophaga qingshengii]MBC9933127.1 GNAT family N-acetyltransferase [Chitinophaga qingshengii]